MVRNTPTVMFSIFFAAQAEKEPGANQGQIRALSQRAANIGISRELQNQVIEMAQRGEQFEQVRALFSESHHNSFYSV